MAVAIKTYSEVYSRMCHFVALRKSDSAVNEVQDALIRESIYLFPNSEIESVGALVRDLFGLSFSGAEIRDSIDRSLTSGVLEASSTQIRCSHDEEKKIAFALASTKELEEAVKKEWCDQLTRDNLIAQELCDAAWAALQHYLSRIFGRHGVEAVEFLDPSRTDGDDETAGVILDEVIKRYLSQLPVQVARSIIRSFVTSRTDKRVLYLSQLLDGTFSFFALTADVETSKLLRHNLVPMKLLLDTNFIFGLLHMHVNAFVSVSNDLISLIRDNKFPFDLYYHPLTVQEFNTVMDFSKQKIIGKEWSPALSRALLKAGFLSGIEYRFHELNGNTKITPKEFFDRYSNVERILQSFGIRVYNDDFGRLLQDDSTLELISKYKMFLSPKEKSHNTLLHDVVLWRTLQSIRKRSSEPFGAGAMFLSCDYSFFNFDRNQLRQNGQVGTVILPNVFLQLLRPFVSRTADFDAKFIETFALPEFRTIHAADNKALSRIGQTLALYSDIDEPLALKLLTDEALISKVRDLKPDDPAIQPLIEQAIIGENQSLRQDLTVTAEKLAAREESLGKVGSELAEIRQEASRQHETNKAMVAAAEAGSSAQKAELQQFRKKVNETALAFQQEKAAREAAEAALAQAQAKLIESQNERIALRNRLKQVSRFCLYFIPAALMLLGMKWGYLKAPPHPRVARYGLFSSALVMSAVDLLLKGHKRRRGLILTSWLIISVLVGTAFGIDWQSAQWVLLIIAILGVVAQIVDK